MQASWAQVDSNYRPRAYQARALTCWAMSPFRWEACFGFLFRLLYGDDGIRTHDPLLAGQVLSQLSYTPMVFPSLFVLFNELFWVTFFSSSLKIEQHSAFASQSCRRLLAQSRPTPIRLDVISIRPFSLERRWSSRTFRYGYLVTT